MELPGKRWSLCHPFEITYTVA